MTLFELENLFDNISIILEDIENSHLIENDNLLYLANGDKIKYKIPLETIPHLLGINIDYLKTLRLFKSEKHYDLLKELLNNAYRINSLHNENKIDYNQLFSTYINEKMNCFKDNIKLNVLNTSFVCKYRSDRSYTVTTNNQKYDYIIVRKTEDQKYMALCLKRRYDCYVPMSNQIFETVEDFEKFMNENVQNQEVTLLNQILIVNEKTDFKKPLYINIGIIIKKLQELNYNKRKYGYIIDTTDSFLYSLNKTTEKMDNSTNDYELLSGIIESIKNGQLIDCEGIKSGNLLKVIDSYNSFIMNGTNIDDTVEKTYSSIISELQILRNEVEQLSIINKELNGKLEEQICENNKLEEENTQYKNTEEAIIKLIRKP